MAVHAAARMAAPTEAPSGASRRVYLDNLKVVLVGGVILGHVLITYGDIGTWEYREPSGNDLFNMLASIVVSLGSLFAMGLFFLIAGWLTPRSLQRKGPGRFARDRLLRLGIPFAAYLFVLYPLVGWIGSGFDGSFGAAVRESLGDLDPGPLWFVGVLLVFSLGYVGYRMLVPPRTPSGELRVGHLGALAAFVAVTSFLIRFWFPVDSYQIFAAHLWQWPQCVTLFVIGIVAGERGWLDPVPDGIRRTAGWAALGGGAVVMAAFAISSESVDPFAGGWTWQAAVTAGTEGVIAVGFAVWLLALFQRHFDRAGPLGIAAGRAAFGAYVLQALVLVTLARALAGVDLTPEVKFVIVAPLGLVLSYGAAWLLTRVPGVRRVV